MLRRSACLDGVSHGFTARAGGVSTGRFATLNLFEKWGDDPAHVAENRRRVAEAAGFSTERLYLARQVHGAEVVVVRGDEPPAMVAAREADVLVSATAGVALGVGTADCVPILVADDAGRVAAAHAGWRGTLADVAGRAVAALLALGARREGLRAALGPSICAGCFEVGAEVADRFRVLGDVVDDSEPKPRVDLQRSNRLLLERAGVPAAHIDAAPPCTMCEPARYFSFRRDGGGIGQHLSFIVAGQ